MKTFTHLALALSFATLSSIASAHTGEAPAAFELPLTQGHAMADVLLNVVGIGKEDGSSILGAVGYQYFLVDKLALGGTVLATYSDSFHTRSVTLSPEASFYFWSHANCAAFVAQSLGWTETASGGFYRSGWAGSTALGFAHFFNHHVALTPRLAARYSEKQPGSLDLNAGLSIFF